MQLGYNYTFLVLKLVQVLQLLQKELLAYLVGDIRLQVVGDIRASSWRH